MDTLGIAALAGDVSQSRTQDVVQLAVLKKAMDIEAQSAMQLVQAAIQAAPSNPPNLGNGVNIFA
ncbi:MAG: YjfB family protein [Propionivibrio sp.]